MTMTQEEKKLRERARKRAYYEANGEKIRAYNRAWQASNVEKVLENRVIQRQKLREYARVYHRTNAEKVRARKINYYEANSEKVREHARTHVEKLTNFYVAATLKLPLKSVPQDLLEAKREQLLIRRMVRQLKKGIKNETI